MSEIKDSSLTSVREKRIYEKYAFFQNITTNPLDYFHCSSDHYYFISPNTGFCILSQRTRSKECVRGQRKIYKFSRGIVSISKRKITAKARRILKLSINNSSNSSEIIRNVFLKRLRRLRKMLVHAFQSAKAAENIKLFVVLAKFEGNKCNQVDKADFMDGAENKKPKETKQLCRKYRKLVLMRYGRSPYLNQNSKKYITTVSLFYKPRKKSFKEFHGTKDAPAVYMGRNPTYPPTLNELFKETICDLCNVNMNSKQAANRHYVSQNHKRRVNSWFHYKSVNRMDIRGDQLSTGIHLPENYCAVCTVKLPSPRHAVQHYNGKRHRNLVLTSVQLNGIGYFDFQGKWIETDKTSDSAIENESSHILVETKCGLVQVALYDTMKVRTEKEVANHPEKILKSLTRQVNPACSEPKNQHAADYARQYPYTSRFENIGSHVASTYTDRCSSLKGDDTAPQFHSYSYGNCSNLTTIVTDDRQSADVTDSFLEAMTTLSCVTCNTTATSRTQMLSHLKGARHLKKVKLNGEFQSPIVTIAESLLVENPGDMSIYRTPSGVYYCGACKITVSDADRMRIHIASKNHTKTMRETKGNTRI